jgi:hypothetical protein
MGRSKPFDLCQIFKQLWEAHPRNKGRIFGPTGRDLKAAKELCDLNEWDELLSEIEPRFKLFMDSDFAGWKEANYPAWGLFTQWNRYLPKAQRREVNRPRIHCSLCEQNHYADEPCKLKEVP